MRHEIPEKLSKEKMVCKSFRISKVFSLNLVANRKKTLAVSV
jgi:hypothetical protein